MADNRLDRPCNCRICAATPDQELGFDASDRKLMADVADHGWHLVMIPDDPVTKGWIFSVGMWHTLGSHDVALFGMDLIHAATVLNDIGALVRSGTTIDEQCVLPNLMDGDRLVTFRAVDPSWYRPLFGYAMWFAQFPPLAMMQVVWSDLDGRWLWADDSDKAYRLAQPRLWLEARGHPMGAWSGTLAPDPWPFEDAPDTTVFTTKRITLDGHPVLGVVHDVDGSWQFLDGGDVTRADIELVHLAHVAGAHPSIVELRDLPPGRQAWRESPEAAWTRSEVVSDT